MISNTLRHNLKETLKKLGISDMEIHLEHPAAETHGDYSSNVAMATFEQFRIQNSEFRIKSPRELARAIVVELQKDRELQKIVENIDVAGPGFINFFLKPDVFVRELRVIDQKKEQYGNGSTLKNKKIMVEFTDPNPFKEFHIGHLFSNTVGESLCRLLESQGATVKRANYQGDIGLHVAKALWGIMKTRSHMPGDDATLSVKAKFMGEAYAMGATAYDEDEQAKTEIVDLNKKIYEKDPDIMALYAKGRQWSLDYFETIYERLGTKFDFYYFESSAGEVGLKLVQEFLSKGVFVESKGAVVFPGEQYGLHTRVFINALGLPTYESKELGLAPTKYKDFPYDESIIVTGNEINEYFRVLIAALKRVFPDLGAKTRHLSHGMVRVPTGKMSSRKGNILTGEWLLDEAKRLIVERMATVEHPLPTKERDAVADQIAVGAVKYALLKSSIGQNVLFDFEKSIAVDGNSGPYLQYTFARTQSVQEKAKGQGLRAEGIHERRATNQEPNREELAILRWIYRFPEVVQSAAAHDAPNEICTFLYELAQRFNTFYNKHRILENNEQKTENREQKTRNTKNEVMATSFELPATSQQAFRLSLTAATGQVLKNGLHLLGIGAPVRM